MQRGSPRTHRDRVLRPDLLRERCFEGRDLGPGRQPIRPQDVDDGGDIRLVDRLAAVGKERRSDRRAAVDGQLIHSNRHHLAGDPGELVDREPLGVGVTRVAEAFGEPPAVVPSVAAHHANSGWTTNMSSNSSVCVSS